MKFASRDPFNKPVFCNPYYDAGTAGTNEVGTKVTRKETRFINFWVKESPTDADGLALMSSGEKVRRCILIFLGICVVAAVVIIGISMLANPEIFKIRPTGRYF